MFVSYLGRVSFHRWLSLWGGSHTTIHPIWCWMCQNWWPLEPSIWWEIWHLIRRKMVRKAAGNEVYLGACEHLGVWVCVCLFLSEAIQQYLPWDDSDFTMPFVFVLFFVFFTGILCQCDFVTVYAKWFHNWLALKTTTSQYDDLCGGMYRQYTKHKIVMCLKWAELGIFEKIIKRERMMAKQEMCICQRGIFVKKLWQEIENM